MTKKGIKRLVVKDDDGNITGILDQISLMSFFASHTYAISNEIEKAEDLEDLKLASQKMIRVIKALYAKGVKVRYISKLISQLNEKIFEKTFLFLAPEELFENSSLIVMGSEGREEQILKTDQDNALILSDDCDIDSDKLMSFTNKFTQTLLEFGYPKCDGFIMVSNPKWVMSESKFKEKLSEWIDKKDGDSFMNMAIVYDAISVAGDKRLLENLKEYMLKNIDVSSALFSSFARASISFETPLGLFSDFSVEKNGLLDIKKGGIFAIVHGIRSLSFEKGLLETNTVVRIKKLNDFGVIDRRLSEDLIESFTFFLSLRLDSNLKHIDCAEETSNFINPKSLSKSQKDLLKDALKTVDKFKKFLTYHYKLNLLG
jgi:CBS domain-containing protein